MAIVYQHRRLDTEEIFYIGIGSRKQRPYSTLNRNKYWHRVVNKAGYKVEVLFNDVDKVQASQIEAYLIAFYGKKINGDGNLVNLQDGGYGYCEYTEEVKKRMSKAKKGMVSSFKGKKHSEEAKKRMSESAKNREKTTGGWKHSEEAKIKMSLAKEGKTSPRKGVILSDETKKKISESKKGTPSFNKGKKMSEEQKKKISEKLKMNYKLKTKIN